MEKLIALLLIVILIALEVSACAWMLGQFGVKGDFGHRALLSVVVAGLLFNGRNSGRD